MKPAKRSVGSKRRASTAPRTPGARETLADLGREVDSGYSAVESGSIRESRPSDAGIAGNALLASTAGRRISEAHIDLSTALRRASPIAPAVLATTPIATPQATTAGNGRKRLEWFASALAMALVMVGVRELTVDRVSHVAAPSHAHAALPVPAPVLGAAAIPAAPVVAEPAITSPTVEVPAMTAADMLTPTNPVPAASPSVETTRALLTDIGSQPVHAMVRVERTAHAPAAAAPSIRANAESASAPAATVNANPTAEIDADHAPANVQAPVAAAAPVSCISRCGDNVTCMAECTVHGRSNRGSGPGSPVVAPASASSHAIVAEGLIDTPSRADVSRAIASVLPAVRQCAGDLGETAYLTITFAGSGRITTANTERPYAGTPPGSCMARAVRSASVSPFARSTFTVRAPFAMH